MLAATWLRTLSYSGYVLTLFLASHKYPLIKYLNILSHLLVYSI
jgi:hypothetical protein